MVFLNPFFDFDGKVQRHDLSRIKEMLVYKGGQLRSVFNFQLFIYTGKSLFYCNFCEMQFLGNFPVSFSGYGQMDNTKFLTSQCFL